MPYLIALGVLLVAYIVTLCLMHRMKNQALVNSIFVATVFLSYMVMVIRFLIVDGIHDWNFQNTLPVANVSPFMFALTPLIFLLPRRLRKHPMLLVSLLSAGMFLSTVLACIFNAVIHYRFHYYFFTDYISHFALSLWGIYLVKSRQVELKIKNCLISGGIIVSVATLMLILNLIFDTSFFGLSLRGKHNIYNNMIVENPYLSAVLYYIGLIGVLALGFVLQKALARKHCQIKE